MATFMYNKEQVLKLLEKNKEDTLVQIREVEQKYRERLKVYLESLPDQLQDWIRDFKLDDAARTGQALAPHFQPPRDYDTNGTPLYSLHQRISWLDAIRKRVELIDSKDGRIRISDKDDVWRALISE